MSEFILRREEERANLFEQIKATITDAESENRDLDASELEKIDRIEADIAAAERSIETAKKNEQRMVEASVAAQGFAVPTEVADDVTIRSMINGEVRNRSFEMRGTVVSSDNLVGRGFADRIFDKMREVGPILQTSEVITTQTGEEIVFPTFGNYSVASLVSEGAAITESEPTFGNITLGAFRYGILIPISNSLLRDSSLDIEGIVANQAGNALSLKINEDHTIGDGTNKPRGIVTGASDSGIVGAANTVSADEIVSLTYTVDQAYRMQPTAGFMVATDTARDIRLLKDGDNRFLYEIRVGEPDQVAGYRLIENKHMESGSAKKSILFGDLAQYKVRVVNTVDVASSADFAFNTDTTTFRVQLSADGDTAQSEGIVFYTQKTIV
jgi:HK97 family phage major capsid protein